MRKIFNFGQKWPGDEDGNIYWISIDPICSNVQYGDGLVIRKECRSLEEIEQVAADIKADLDRVLSEARKKLGKS